MRRGLWSPEEDEKLRHYLLKHGYESWTEVPKKAGLQRCGKSCRLRWINYLKPGLRRSKFTPDEIKLVMGLHEVYGNRWSKIASHMEGRTDNDVKNLWNSHIRRRLLKLNVQMKISCIPNTFLNPPNSLSLEKSKDHTPLTQGGNSNQGLNLGLEKKARVFPFRLDLEGMGQGQPLLLPDYIQKGTPTLLSMPINKNLGLHNEMGYYYNVPSSLNDAIPELDTDQESTLEPPNCSYSCDSLINQDLDQDQDQDELALNHLYPPWYNCEAIGNELMGEVCYPPPPFNTIYAPPMGPFNLQDDTTFLLGIDATHW